MTYDVFQQVYLIDDPIFLTYSFGGVGSPVPAGGVVLDSKQRDPPNSLFIGDPILLTCSP